MPRFSLGLLLALYSSVSFAIPDIQHWQTANGARVYFMPAPELPIVDLELVFDAGSARDAGQAGIATLVNGMLSEGADGLSADQVLERFAELGAKFSNSLDRDMSSFNLRSLADPELLQPALATLGQVVTRPDFPADAIERLRKLMLQSLAYKKQSPGDLASTAFYAALYGDHPYASPPEGTEASVSALSRDHLREFYARYYVANNAVIALVGAIDRERAEQIAEQLSRDLPAGEAAPPLPPVAPLASAVERHIEYPSTQTHLLLGQTGYARHDPDYFPLYVGNHILGGGGLVSQLTEQIREQRGLSYSVYSYLLPLRAAGPFVAGLQTRNDQAAAALEVMRQVVRDFVEQGPSEAELKAAQQDLTGGFALKLDSNAKLLSHLAMIGFYRMPLDYLHTWTAQVEAVTLEHVREVAKRRLQPDKMVLISAGVRQTGP